MLKASIVIPTYNRGAVLCNTIAMALEQTYPSCEVIVVDQSPSLDPEVCTYIESVRDRIQFIRLSTPNLPAARNVGVRAATGEIIVFIDDDVIIAPNYIASHARHYEEPSVGAVMSLPLPEGDVDVDAVLAAACRLFEVRSELKNGIASVNSVAGCSSSFRRKAIVEAGMSDERFFGSGWGEDTDLSIRVRHQGYTLLLDSGIKMIHLALSSGGCQNRDPQRIDRREEERLQLTAWYLIKNCHILGLRVVGPGLKHAYRGYALNKQLLQRGFLAVVRRHVLYSQSILRAVRWRWERK